MPNTPPGSGRSQRAQHFGRARQRTRGEQYHPPLDRSRLLDLATNDGRKECDGSVADVSLAGTSQRTPVLPRSQRQQHRQLDPDDGHLAAGLPPDGQGHRRGRHPALPVPADARARCMGRRGCRPRRQTQDDPVHSGRPSSARVCARVPGAGRPGFASGDLPRVARTRRGRRHRQPSASRVRHRARRTAPHFQRRFAEHGGDDRLTDLRSGAGGLDASLDGARLALHRQRHLVRGDPVADLANRHDSALSVAAGVAIAICSAGSLRRPASEA